MQAPRSAPKSSVATSSDGNTVSRPISSATTWSMLLAARKSLPSVRFGGMPVSHEPVQAWSCRTLRLGPGEIADDGQGIAERFERLQDGRQFETGTARRRGPLVQDHAVRHVDEPQAPGRRGGRLRRGRHGRHHRLEERKADGRAHAAQERPAGQRALGDEHQSAPFAGFENDGLVTIPSTIDDHRYCS